jgi:tRNA-uridine 2-sulfurtransferase
MNSLGFNKDPKNTRVVVAMSGGVDSSVVAALLHEEGYEVVGVTLQLYDYGAALAKKGACCAGQDIHDARRVAEEKAFPHYVLNYENNFRESVIDDFANSYLKGETPVPCIRCNQTVKFRDLLKVAQDLNADCLATGHYVQRVLGKDGCAQMHRAADPAKDQSYFLFATTQEQLDFLRFPLGGWDKRVTRGHAQRLGLLNAEKPDSQDICFVPGGDYAKVVKKLRPEAGEPGDIIHLDGRVMGRHAGIIHYTIGQRKGLGIGGGHVENNEPFYVVAVDAAKRQVIVGPKQALARDILYIRDCNWLENFPVILSASEGSPRYGDPSVAMLPQDDSHEVTVKFRSMMSPAAARLQRTSATTAELHLEAPQYGIAPGQAAVCYEGGRMIGGGWIAGTGNKTMLQAA